MSGNVTNHVCKKSFRHRELIYVKFLLTLYLWICFCTSFCIKELGHLWKEFLAFQNRLKAHLLQVKKSCLLRTTIYNSCFVLLFWDIFLNTTVRGQVNIIKFLIQCSRLAISNSTMHASKHTVVLKELFIEFDF